MTINLVIMIRGVVIQQRNHNHPTFQFLNSRLASRSSLQLRKALTIDCLRCSMTLEKAMNRHHHRQKHQRKTKKSKDYSWFDLFYDETVDPFKMPDGSPVPKGYVYDGSRLVRHRKNSRRVPGYPSDLWGRLSQKERNMRWEEYQKRLKDKEESKGTCAQELNHERFAVPSMPVEYRVYEPHRSNMRSLVEDKLKEVQNKLDFDLFATVARVLTKTEIAKSPGASKALDIEWNKLLNKKTWDQNKVKECRSIVEEARRKGEKVHIGRIFEICTLKGNELPEGDPNRKYKGRTCFQGNNVFDESSDYAIFAEMSSSPASMEAAKILDAYGCQPRHSKEGGRCQTGIHTSSVHRYPYLAAFA